MSLRGSVSRRSPGLRLASLTIAFAVTVALTTTARAQAQPSAAAIDVGQAAPDFSLPGATRYGVLRDPVSLASFRGKTVVLAYFYKARTRG